MPEYTQEQIGEFITNAWETGFEPRVKDSHRVNGMSLDELVTYINLEHNAIDTLVELNDTDIQEGLTSGHLLYYSGSKCTNASQLPLDFHVKSTDSSREIKIESTSGSTSTQSLNFKQPDVEWRIEHKRASNTSAGLEVSDGSNTWKFETTGALKFAKLTSEPSEHWEGSMYYNGNDNNFYVALVDSDAPPNEGG